MQGGIEHHEGSGAGGSGSIPGSQGQPDTDAFYRAELEKSKKKGLRTIAYVNGLLNLGMHYNRVNKFADASRVLQEAIALVDSGVIKPSSKETLAKQSTMTVHEGNGVSSATINAVPKPYEELMQNLLPALISAESGSAQYKQAEIHIKRLIALASTDPVSAKLNLMSAYRQYAEVLRKTHRTAEAKVYEQKADTINKSFKPL